jgi:peptidoglycan hydrolase CwlO-like protein
LKPNTEYDILSQKLKEVDKEINFSNNETENFKKQIDNLKNKIEFKNNLEKAISLENLLKLETNKNKDIKRELDSLNRVHSLQIKALDNYDKENRFSEKIEILKAEIKLIKDNLKELSDKHSKQDKYLKHIHEKLISVENLSKKLLIPKIEYKKSFTRDELKSILDEMNTLKNKIEENRRNLKQMNKMYEDKLNKYLTLNKKIEYDYKENIKVRE